MVLQPLVSPSLQKNPQWDRFFPPRELHKPGVLQGDFGGAAARARSSPAAVNQRGPDGVDSASL